MEANIARALHDPLTLSELAVLTLYAQAVTKPYTHIICAPGTEDLNILDMGPLHESLIRHIAFLINKPSTIFSSDPTAYMVATFDNHPWDDPNAVLSILFLYQEKKLLHIESLLVAFLKGAHNTWKHFMEEFAPSGLIATSTAEEHDFASMPTSNDVNEGMLGSWHQFFRAKPSLTASHFTDQIMFS